jgi:LysM repeat protein
MTRAQEESEAMKESALLERRAKADMKRVLKPMRKGLPTDSASDAVDLNASAVPAVPGSAESSLRGTQASNVHVVKPGETLYRISRKYGITVDNIRKWNKLPDDILEVGQKLIVGQE